VESVGNLDVSSQPATSGLNKGHLSTERNLQDVSPIEIRPFPRAERHEDERQG
jgi:hypothetical protein